VSQRRERDLMCRFISEVCHHRMTVLQDNDVYHNSKLVDRAMATSLAFNNIRGEAAQ